MATPTKRAAIHLDHDRRVPPRKPRLPGRAKGHHRDRTCSLAGKMRLVGGELRVRQALGLKGRETTRSGSDLGNGATRETLPEDAEGLAAFVARRRAAESGFLGKVIQRMDKDREVPPQVEIRLHFSLLRALGRISRARR